MTDGRHHTWNPDRYSAFADHRLRPGTDLLQRIPAEHPAVVVDLGCGTGNLTGLLQDRWPQARVVGVDSSPEMLAAARNQLPALEWQQADISRWQPEAPVDVIFSNAALHWLPRHEELVPGLMSHLRTGATLALQMPDNWEQPTHTIPELILAESQWPETARIAFLRRPVARPSQYRAWLRGATSIDIWQTTYHQALTGDDPIFEWVRGSVLGPVLDALDDEEAALFADRVKAGYRAAYPPAADGTTVLPFTRLFIIAVK